MADFFIMTETPEDKPDFSAFWQQQAQKGEQQ
jgi:hypothetical protein